jgi:transcriptional regulator with XRE-family HTH domain
MTTLLTADLVRAGRALLGWSQLELGRRSGLSQKALSDFELGKKPITAKASDKIRKVLEEQRVQFIAVNGESSDIDGAGVRWCPEHNAMNIKIL